MTTNSANDAVSESQSALLTELQRDWVDASAGRIDTHSACLLMAPDRVLKIKRAVQYSYLDMRALDTRKRLLYRELELNQPVLPDVYERVAPIRRGPDGRLRVGSPDDAADPAHGEVLEWALVMRRFDERQVLDAIADCGEFDVRLAASTGRAIADYHAQLPPTLVDDADARLGEVVEELAEALAPFAPWLGEATLRGFIDAARAALDRHATRLRRRGEQGVVKRCHGDLHLRNLVLHQGSPRPFDALEFDERMATCDVLYDVAFLWMDIAHRQLPAEANRAFNAYLAYADRSHHADLGVLPLMLACRAGIRAMTSAQASDVDDARRDDLRDASRRYLEQAGEDLAPRRTTLIAVGGLSGCGKSTLARDLAWQRCRAPGAVLLQSDVERKRHAGVELTERLDASHYTAEASDLNYQRLLGKCEACLQAGHSVIIDAVFLKRDERQRVAAIASASGADFHGLWLDAPADVLAARIDARRGDASDATREVLALQQQLRNDHAMLAASTPGATDTDWQDVDASGDPASTLSLALAVLPDRDALA